MSTIAEEITDLQDNLAAAKAAVTAAGGTVGDTGLAGLAAEIATVPSGGGGTQSDWEEMDSTSGAYVKNRTHYDDNFDFNEKYPGEATAYPRIVYTTENVGDPKSTQEYPSDMADWLYNMMFEGDMYTQQFHIVRRTRASSTASWVTEDITPEVVAEIRARKDLEWGYYYESDDHAFVTTGSGGTPGFDEQTFDGKTYLGASYCEKVRSGDLWYWENPSGGIMIDEDDNIYFIYGYQYAGTWPRYTRDGTIKTLDEKYLPSGMAKNVDWTAESGSLGYIANRPMYDYSQTLDTLLYNYTTSSPKITTDFHIYTTVSSPAIFAVYSGYFSVDDDTLAEYLEKTSGNVDFYKNDMESVIHTTFTGCTDTTITISGTTYSAKMWASGQIIDDGTSRNIVASDFLRTDLEAGYSFFQSGLYVPALKRFYVLCAPDNMGNSAFGFDSVGENEYQAYVDAWDTYVKVTGIFVHKLDNKYLNIDNDTIVNDNGVLKAAGAGGDGSDMFIAVLDVTTGTEVQAALTAGKKVWFVTTLDNFPSFCIPKIQPAAGATSVVCATFGYNNTQGAFYGGGSCTVSGLDSSSAITSSGWNEGKFLAFANSTGTSQTYGMSQNAVTSMVYADPGTNSKVRIGGRADFSGTNSVKIGGDSTGFASNYGVAIGHSAAAQPGSVAIGYGAKTLNQGTPYAVSVGYSAGPASGNANGCISLGAYSQATHTGEMNIGSSNTSYGYNSSNYRLLTGVYDGQSAHDAATKGQLDTAILNGGTTAPTTSTVGAVGTQYTYVDTTGTPTAHLCVCTEIDNTDPSNPVYTWSTLI